LPYNAPESLNNYYSEGVDIWSFGCVFFEIIKLERLFKQKNETELRNSICNFRINEFLANTDIEHFFVTILKKYKLFLIKIFNFNSIQLIKGLCINLQVIDTLLANF